jgi:hypothetical protein
MRKSAVVLVAVVAAFMAPAALADNGSFETGDFTGWTVDTPSGSADVFPGGAPGGGSYFGAVGAGNEDEWQSISTSLSLQAGDAVSAAALFYNAESDDEKCFYDDMAQVVVLLDGNVVATLFAANACAAPGQSAGPWGGTQVYVSQDGVYTIVAQVKNVGDGAVASQVWLDSVAARTPRAAYCAAAGNTAPDGSKLTAGSFLNLRVGQPGKDPSYAGATLARFVEGKGLTCDAAPAGYVQKGFAGDAQHVPDGLYAYYVAA